MNTNEASSLFGLRIVESPDVPRYTLPAEVLPGIPWPTGFRAAINSWSLAFLGTTNLVPEGGALVLGGNTLLMRPKTIGALKSICGG
jgi:hypothetical protein